MTDAAATGSGLAGRFDVDAPSDAPESGSAASQSPLSPTRRRSWREVPTALVMLLPSMVLLGTFVIYPLVRAVFLGRERCDALGNHCTTNGWHQYVDVFRSSRVPALDRREHQVRADDRADRRRCSASASAILADKQLRGHRPVPHRLLLDRRHVGRRRLADVVLPAATRHRRARQHRLVEPPVPGDQGPGTAARSRHGAVVDGDHEHLGQPRVHVHPRHRRAAGHPPRPLRERVRRRRRWLDPRSPT